MRSLLFFLVTVTLVFQSCAKQAEPAEQSGDGRVIVLMYHRIISGSPEGLYARNVKDFEKDLQYLNEKNISIISFEDLGQMVKSGKGPVTDCAILTFDDGDHSWYDYVRPLIIKYKAEATFFLWTSMIDKNSFLSWSEVENMSHYTYSDNTRPFVFASHTMYHQLLLSRKKAYNDPSKFADYLDEEFGGSKKLIENHTPQTVTAVSLPFGDGAGDADIINGAVRNGYQFIRTSEWYSLDPKTVNLFRIPSFPMLDTTHQEQISTILGR